MTDPVTGLVLGGAAGTAIWTGVYTGARANGKSHEAAVKKANKYLENTYKTVSPSDIGNAVDSSAHAIQRSSYSQ